MGQSESDLSAGDCRGIDLVLESMSFSMSASRDDDKQLRSWLLKLAINMSDRSPIKDKPLRSPGQSLEEQMRELFDNKVMIPLVGAVMFTVFAVMEWYRHFSGVPPAPKTMTVLAVLTIG